jgi:hypothetical protein
MESGPFRRLSLPAKAWDLALQKAEIMSAFAMPPLKVATL